MKKCHYNTSYEHSRMNGIEREEGKKIDENEWFWNRRGEKIELDY